LKLITNEMSNPGQCPDQFNNFGYKSEVILVLQ